MYRGETFRRKIGRENGARSCSAHIARLALISRSSDLSNTQVGHGRHQPGHGRHAAAAALAERGGPFRPREHCTENASSWGTISAKGGLQNMPQGNGSLHRCLLLWNTVRHSGLQSCTITVYIIKVHTNTCRLKSAMHSLSIDIYELQWEVSQGQTL